MEKISLLAVIWNYFSFGITHFICSIFKSSASYFLKSNKDDITVTGSASVDFTSNLIVWRGNFSKKIKI